MGDGRQLQCAIAGYYPFDGAETRIRCSATNERGKSWCEGADLLRSRAEAADAQGHPLTAASNYLRANFYYQSADHFQQLKDERALDVYRRSLDCFSKFAALTDRPRVEKIELPAGSRLTRRP